MLCGCTEVLKGSLIITTKRLQRNYRTLIELQRTYRKSESKGGKLARGVLALTSVNENPFLTGDILGNGGLIRPRIFPLLAQRGAVTSSHPARQENGIR